MDCGLVVLPAAKIMVFGKPQLLQSSAKDAVKFVS